jgi:hypothetical protein
MERSRCARDSGRLKGVPAAGGDPSGGIPLGGIPLANKC